MRPDDAGAVLPAGGGLVTNSAFKIGETNFGGPMTYDVDLGAVAEIGIRDTELILVYNGPNGIVRGEIGFIPEPAAAMLIGLALCGAIASRRSRVA